MAAGWNVVLDTNTVNVDGAPLSGDYKLAYLWATGTTLCYRAQVVNCQSTGQPKKCFFLEMLIYEVNAILLPMLPGYLPDDLEEGDRVILLNVGTIPLRFVSPEMSPIAFPEVWSIYTRFIKVVEAGQTLDCNGTHELGEVDVNGDPVPGGPFGAQGIATLTATGEQEWDPYDYFLDYLWSAIPPHLGIGCLPNRYTITLSGWTGSMSRFNGMYFLDKVPGGYPNWLFEAEVGGYEVQLHLWSYGGYSAQDLFFRIKCEGEWQWLFWTVDLIDDYTIPGMQWSFNHNFLSSGVFHWNQIPPLVCDGTHFPNDLNGNETVGMVAFEDCG